MFVRAYDHFIFEAIPTSALVGVFPSYVFIAFPQPTFSHAVLKAMAPELALGNLFANQTAQVDVIASEFIGIFAIVLICTPSKVALPLSVMVFILIKTL